MRPLSASQVAEIVTLLHQQVPHKEIQRRCHVSHGTITNIRSEHCPDLPKATGGCPRKLTDTGIRHATRLITSSEVDTASAAASILRNTTGEAFSDQTMHTELKHLDLKSGAKHKLPMLTKKHTAARTAWAEAHAGWTLEDWKRVIWSDETKINHIGSNGMKWIWKRSGEPLSKRLVEETLKHGEGRIMFWGCFS